MKIDPNKYVALYDHLQVWKRVWILEARSENGVEMTIFCFEISQDSENLATHLHQEFPGGTPPDKQIVYMEYGGIHHFSTLKSPIWSRNETPSNVLSHLPRSSQSDIKSMAEKKKK